MRLPVRKRVKIAFIANDASRRTTYNKRKKGLLKKVKELSILCGVPACAIIYGENSSEPELWPPCPTSVQPVVSKFLEMSMTEQAKNMHDQESFTQHMVTKTERQLLRLRKDNREMEVLDLVHRGMDGLGEPGWLHGLSMPDLTDLDWVIGQMLNRIRQVQEKLGEAGPEETNKMAKDKEAAEEPGT